MSAHINLDRVRDLYSRTTGWRTEVPEGRDDLRRLQEKLRAEFDAALAAHDAELRQTIANQVRRNCTLPWPLPVGTDATVYAVADWIENPPEWVMAQSRSRDV